MRGERWRPLYGRYPRIVATATWNKTEAPGKPVVTKAYEVADSVPDVMTDLVIRSRSGDEIGLGLLRLAFKCGASLSTGSILPEGVHV